jgi:hypothetical protein
MKQRILMCALLLVLSGCGTAQPAPDATPLPPATFAPLPRSERGSRADQVLRLAGTVLSVDIAVHPREGWPAVVAVDAPLTTRDEARPYVRVLHPLAHSWGSAQSLGSGNSGLATRFRTAAVATASDGSVYVAWGAARSPRLGVYAAWSRDYGATWSTPEPLVADSYGVLDMLALPDGGIAVLANGERVRRPLLIERSPAGSWSEPQALPVPSWYGTSGALAVLGQGDDAEIVAATSGGGESSPNDMLFVARRRLSGGAWQVERRQAGTGGLLARLRSVDLGEQGALFTFESDGMSAVYGVLVGPNGVVAERIVAGGAGAEPYAAPAYDAASRQAIVLWTCCADALFVAAPSTHYAAWGAPGRADWHSPRTAALITGAESAADTAIAQVAGSEQIWLAWADRVHDVRVRVLDLRLVAPYSAGEASQ